MAGQLDQETNLGRTPPIGFAPFPTISAFQASQGCSLYRVSWGIFVCHGFMRMTLDCSFAFIFGLVEMWQSLTWKAKMMMISSLKSMSNREAPNLSKSSLLNLKSWCFQRSFSFLVASQGTKLLKSWGVANTRNLPFTWLFIAKACTLLAVDGPSTNNIFCSYLPIGVVCCVYQLPEPTSFIEIMVNIVWQESSSCFIFQWDNFWVLGPW